MRQISFFFYQHVDRTLVMGWHGCHKGDQEKPQYFLTSLILMFGRFSFNSQCRAVSVTEVNADSERENIILICFCYELC